MKKLLGLTIGLFFSIVLLQAQNDTIYFMKNGVIVNQQSILLTDVDSVIFYLPVIIPDPVESFTDSRDDNVYQVVQIGEQVWMGENLKYLPSVVGPATGSEISGFASESYYYVYDYDGTDVTEAKATDNYNTYGVLYNWNAVMAGEASSNTNPSGVQGVCPAGWHLPSNAELVEMEEYLIANGYNYDGTITDNKFAKSLAATTNWNPSAVIGAPGNTDFPEYRNKSGFTALPGGYRVNGGTFSVIGTSAYWWSATSVDTNLALNRGIYSNFASFDSNNSTKARGHSVRCVRD